MQAFIKIIYWYLFLEWKLMGKSEWQFKKDKYIDKKKSRNIKLYNFRI